MRSHTVNSFKRNTANFRAKDERVPFVFQTSHLFARPDNVVIVDTGNITAYA